MNTYLINAPHDQKIKTVEGVNTAKILAYSNPAYYKTKSLARDFGDIEVGDQIIICRDSQLKYIATVDEIIMATDASGSAHNGLPVKILKGHLTARFDRVSVAVIAQELDKSGIIVPNIVSPKLNGFKQGAFAEKLTNDQLEVVKRRTS